MKRANLKSLLNQPCITETLVAHDLALNMLLDVTCKYFTKNILCLSEILSWDSLKLCLVLASEQN